MKTRILLLLTLFICSNLLFANEDETVADETTLELNSEEASEMLAYMLFLDSIESNFNYETGLIELRGGIGTIEVPEGYKYLNGDDAAFLLEDIWGNPPVPEEDKSLGMLMKEESSIKDYDAFVIDISFTEDGHIKDDDAHKIDYDDMMKDMKASSKEENKARAEMGYGPIEVIGWAAQPFYDGENKKLHWAQELNFDNSDENTLNYNILALGRRGYIMLNVIGGMEALEEVNQDIDPILASVNFNEGHRYADFDPQYDKVAAYGIGALVAGKVLAKAGILAKLGLVFAKFGKFILVGIVAAFAGIRRFITGGRKEEEPAA